MFYILVRKYVLNVGYMPAMSKYISALIELAFYFSGKTEVLKSKIIFM